MKQINHRRQHYTVFWGAVLIVVGLLILLANFDVLSIGTVIARFWPIILVAFGLKLLLRSSRRNNSVFAISVDREHEATATSGLIERSNVFGDLNLHIKSQNFQGGSVSNVFGDLDIDLSEIDLPPGEHRLSLNGIFGSIDIQLPRKVPFAIQGSCSFGDVRILGERQGGISPRISYQSEGYDAAEKKLLILTHQVFGDIKGL